MEAMRLPISKSQRGKLVSAGYTSLSSLSSVSPSDLACDLRISENEAAGILKVASPSTRPDSTNRNHSVINGAQTAWDMLHEEELCTPISTSCAELDDILGGGIRCKEVTEIGGVPGVGKTQLGVQLAVNVQIPIDSGGLGGKAMYIDSEGSFMPERALQIAEACVEDMLARDGNLKKNFQASRFQMQPRDFLENIIRIGICSYTELIAVINQLERFISKDKDVRLVIIDSITFYFRQDFDDMALRTRLLSAMALKLMKLAKTHNVAVVILNQATAKISDSSFHLTLALGDTWSHACTNRVILYWNGDDRYAYIDKSPSLQSASAPFSVTRKGIRSLATGCKRIKMMQAVD